MRKNRSPAVPYSCPLLECMQILGGAWTPNIIWNLRAGPRRFSELRSDIPLVSPKVLTTRLRELESWGVLERNVMPTSPPSVEYSLSDLGQRLVPAIDAIAEVGEELKKRKVVSDDAKKPSGRPRHLGRRRPGNKAAG
ncbi:helix-turn-helix domain-containing protein [Thalassospiraceae bacterium LMO-JJ14]|nr:helix-turn-helix domain-containing protein [Thalassospiraceae bacterium LMO-JJ14]